MEALELCYEEVLKVKAYEEEIEKTQDLSIPKPSHAAVLFGTDPNDYVMDVLSKIRPNNLELAISQLPFALVSKLAYFLQNAKVIEKQIELVRSHLF